MPTPGTAAVKASPAGDSTNPRRRDEDLSAAGTDMPNGKSAPCADYAPCMFQLMAAKGHTGAQDLYLRMLHEPWRRSRTPCSQSPRIGRL
jgi:hypothetical protein